MPNDKNYPVLEIIRSFISSTGIFKATGIFISPTGILNVTCIFVAPKLTFLFHQLALLSHQLAILSPTGNSQLATGALLNHGG